jgi:hypothetical protein
MPGDVLVKRRFSGLVLGAALALGLFDGAAIQAAEPSIRVVESPSTREFNARIQKLTDNILADSLKARDVAPGNGAMRYFDLNKPLSEAPSFAELPAADQILMQAAKRTYDLFRAMGGPAVSKFLGVAAEKDRFFIALDGEGGRWVASPPEALGALAQQLAQQQLVLQRDPKTSIGCPFNIQCLLVANYKGAIPTVAFVPRGTTVTLEMTGNGFLNTQGLPILVTSDQLTVHEVTFVSSEALTAKISIPLTASLGENLLVVFNEGQSFRSQEAYLLNVVASIDDLTALFAGSSSSETASTSGTGSGSATTGGLVNKDGVPGLEGSGRVETLADDHPNEAASAHVLATQLSGRIEKSGDTDLFRIDIPQSGALTVSSTGPSDVSAVLMDSNGNVIASDDDGGVRYNFSVSAAVTAGTYYLKVSHCCVGTGTYKLTRQFQPY